MATLLEDEDLIAQAQERERARLEEEAQILAFQQQQQAALPPPVWQGSSTSEIDAFNAAPGVISAPTTIGSEQYMNELARAQRGSGFVNADVSPTGDVIVPGYDPLKDFAALKAQQEATNLQRNQYVDSLVQGGATYAEAYRAGQGRYPQARNDAMRLKVEQLAQRAQARPLMQPEVAVIDGVKVLRTGPNSFSRIPEPGTATATKLPVPPELAASQKIITGKIADARADLQRAQKEIEKDRTNVDAVNAALRARGKLRGLEQSLVTGSTNWMGGAQAPIPVAPAASTPAQGSVVVIKDGRRYSLPKSQLDEALKSGYKLGQ